MIIKKITSITKYKSFKDFNWTDFCKNKAGQEVPLNKYNIFFGENGSGKSSVCEILKDLSLHTPFENPNETPQQAIITIEDDQGRVTDRTYSRHVWDLPLEANSILFFDQNFIDRNIHSNGLRSAEKNKHSQNSGKLIVELDEKATELKSKVKLKEVEADEFDIANGDKITQQFNEGDRILYNQYKDKSAEEIDQIKNNATQNVSDARNALEKLRPILKQITSISKISSPSKLNLENKLSPIEKYQEIFSRKIEDQTEIKASQKLKDHIKKHKTFIEDGLQVLSESIDKDTCPFCLQSLSSQEEILKAYRDFFSNTYKEQKRLYVEDIDTLKRELESLQAEAKGLTFQFSALIDGLDKIKIEFATSDLYNLQQRILFNGEIKNVSEYPSALNNLIDGLENLKKIDHPNVDYNTYYKSINEHQVKIALIVERINSFLGGAGGVIGEFKRTYSDEDTVTTSIEVEEFKLRVNETIANFFLGDKLRKQSEQAFLIEERKKLRLEINSHKTALAAYLKDQAPDIVLKKMTALLDKFNLDFRLVPDKVQGTTAEFPFTFKIIDKDGKERNIKTGLSEGERQLISLAFFFAINDKVTDKDKKVVIFDDPITSLDAANLKILADEIFLLLKSFGQIIVFTHHPLFHKYFAKHQQPNPNKFGILKNIPAFGGSFIFYDPGFDTVAQLNSCHQDILLRAQATVLNIEEVALQYGHLLRLTTERFIKNDLLLWDKENSLGVLTTGLKDAQSKIKLLNDSELDTIDKIYNYCNYSNLLHADKEASSALAELLTHVGSLIAIINKVHNPPTAATTAAAFLGGEQKQN
jgi:wobble nucleotide-excising tRNase